MNAIARPTDEKQPLASDLRYMQEIMHRMHRGRWPTLKSYGNLSRSGACFYEVARWLRMRTDKPYCVVTWNVAELSISSLNFRTLAEARKYRLVVQAR